MPSSLALWDMRRMPPAYTPIISLALNGLYYSAQRYVAFQRVCSGWRMRLSLSRTQSHIINADFWGSGSASELADKFLGEAINLGLNANNNKAGKVSYNVCLVFIALQALGPFAGLLLNRPSKVQRTDGVPIKLAITQNASHELKAITKLFFSKNFLLLVPLIAQGIVHIRYFVVGELASTDAEVIRIAGLLRGTESAVQHVSVGF
jgi:hypothetical protein